MFRVFGGALRNTLRYVQTRVPQTRYLLPRMEHGKQFSSIIAAVPIPGHHLTPNLLLNPKIQQVYNNITTRSVTKFSWRSGKRKTVKAVLRRFYRLHWGGWIRTKAGRHKKLWKKSPERKRRLRQHVFCNATQSTLLDKMVTNFWRKPKYYIDDPYASYHTREEYKSTYNQPKPYFPKEDNL